MTLMTHVLELEKLSKCHLKGKTERKWANGLEIYDSEKKEPKGWYTCIVPLYSKFFFSETVGPIKATLHVGHP